MGLAPLIVAELYELVGSSPRQGMTILLVEQFVTTALSVATRAAIMVHGRIEQEGSPDEMAEAALSATWPERPVPEGTRSPGRPVTPRRPARPRPRARRPRR